MDCHEAQKKFKYNTCENTFHIKWRLKKHEENHKGTSASVTQCRYFSNQELCPYKAIGQKFLHVQTELCRFKDCQDLLCPLAHQNVINDEEPMQDEDPKETLQKLNENQCHICRIQLLTKDGLFDNVQANHEEYFNGMMEVAALKMQDEAGCLIGPGFGRTG